MVRVNRVQEVQECDARDDEKKVKADIINF
jgi:hypothetical protein